MEFVRFKNHLFASWYEYGTGNLIIITAQIRLKLLKACFVMTSRMFAVDRNKHFIDKIMLMLCCSLLIFRSPPETLDTPLKAHRSLASNNQTY